MTSVEFVDNGNKVFIQCNENDKLGDIIQKFNLKAKKNLKEMIFLYSGNIIDENKTYKELVNLEDQKRKKCQL